MHAHIYILPDKLLATVSPYTLQKLPPFRSGYKNLPSGQGILLKTIKTKSNTKF